MTCYIYCASSLPRRKFLGEEDIPLGADIVAALIRITLYASLPSSNVVLVRKKVAIYKMSNSSMQLNSYLDFRETLHTPQQHFTLTIQSLWSSLLLSRYKLSRN